MDIILYNIGAIIISLLIGYLMGSIPNAIWIGKVFFHKDPRDYGSGNAGGTNAGRVLGKKIGVLVIFLDAVKLIIPLYAVWAILTYAPIYHGSPLMGTLQSIYIEGNNDYVIKWPVYWLTAVGCGFGHCYPLFAQFKGGKNVSSTVGLITSVSWVLFVLCGISFFGTLKLKKYVSLASMVTGWLAVIIEWIWAILIMTGVLKGQWIWFIGYGATLDIGYVYAICLTFSVILLTIKHRSNIERLLNGNERKITWMK